MPGLFLRVAQQYPSYLDNSLPDLVAYAQLFLLFALFCMETLTFRSSPVTLPRSEPSFPVTPSIQSFIRFKE